MIVDLVNIHGLHKESVDVAALGMVKQYITGYVDDMGNPGTMPGKPGSKWLNPIFSPNVEDAEIDENGQPKSHWGYETENGFIGCGITGMSCVFSEEAVTLTNLEVTAHNIRPDYYYDGVITMADVALSLNDHVDANGNKNHSASLVIWPTLDTGAKVESYAIDTIDGLGTSGFYGWNYGWHHLMALGNPEMDIGGGNSPHMVGDMAILTSPDSISFYYTNMYEQYYEVQQNVAGDAADPYRLTRSNVLTPKFPLPETHFGRGVADCGMCHSAADMNFDSGNAAHKGEIEPAKCAECHGSNGAPKGHNKVAGCYRCHQSMTGHGDAVVANKTVHPFEQTGSGLSKVMPDPYACVSCHTNDNPHVVGGL
ncbi:cytochrome c3 family protein [Ferrimonas sp. YFM]|uniref:cytochrome c3 family protein n=1 Tax=Ferrimonas sp. YFM TaxID=3028878 RepID=UPI002574157B|nr:cytochrome c3 family protein [Ferrimonas sp. YFM]